MPIEVRMPQPFSSNDEGTIAKWLIKEGQRVNPGDVIAEIEADEATVEIEAVEGGRVARLLVAEGTCRVKVNAPIALLEEAGAATTVAHGPGAEDTAKVESTRTAPPIAGPSPRVPPGRAKAQSARPAVIDARGSILDADLTF